MTIYVEGEKVIWLGFEWEIVDTNILTPDLQDCYLMSGDTEYGYWVHSDLLTPVDPNREDYVAVLTASTVLSVDYNVIDDDEYRCDECGRIIDGLTPIVNICIACMEASVDDEVQP